MKKMKIIIALLLFYGQCIYSQEMISDIYIFLHTCKDPNISCTSYFIFRNELCVYEYYTPQMAEGQMGTINRINDTLFLCPQTEYLLRKYSFFFEDIDVDMSPHKLLIKGNELIDITDYATLFIEDCTKAYKQGIYDSVTYASFLEYNPFNNLQNYIYYYYEPPKNLDGLCIKKKKKK